jgi:hypothetical protein
VDDNGAVRQLLRWAGLVVVVACAVVGVTSTDVGAQSAGNGLEEQSVNSFDFEPSRGVVRVTIDITLRNVTTDRVDGNIVRRTFFDSYAVAVPLGAENIAAVGDGTVLAGTLLSDPDSPAFSAYRFELASPLFSGDSTTLQVTYDHLGAPPRDPVPWRVNEAYAGFVALGLGDDGLVTLRISRPAGFEFDEFTDLSDFDVSAPDALGTTVYTRAGLGQDARITVGMADDTRLVPRELDVEGVDIRLRSWPDDPEWADFAAGRVETGIPALGALIGIDWPVEGSFAVRQTVEPNLYGYAGWFDARSNEIAVGEALDADTIYHELSHAWFNRGLSTERWLTEGLAQVYAAELVRRDGASPRVPIAPRADSPGALPLTEWASDVAEPDRVIEEYGYDASFWVLDVLVAEIGFDRTRDVVTVLRNAASPYDPDAPVERPDEEWQRVHDALVEVGGSATAGDVFRSHVVGPADVGLIDQRDRRAAQVADLALRSAPWSLPLGVRSQLERWDLDDVGDSVRAADDVIERRSIVEAIEVATGIDEPDGAGALYATAPAPAAGAVDFGQANALLDESIRLGEQLVDRQLRIAELAGPGEVTPPDIAGLDGVGDFATGSEAAATQLLAVERIIELDERLASASGLLVSIGRWGSDIDSDIDEARDHVESGEAEDALDTLAAADGRIDDLALAGTLRLTIAGAVVIALALALFAIRRRRRRPRDEVDQEPETTGDDARSAPRSISFRRSAT